MEEQLFVTFMSEPLKQGCYLNAKLNVYKDKIRNNSHGENIPYNQYCKATALLKIKLVYKKVSIYYLQVYMKKERMKPIEKCRLFK